MAPFAVYHELRSVVGNGVCLCRDCHHWLHSNAGRAQREAWEAEALAELGHLLTPREEVA
jgi:predicted restriction endonuclease